MRQFHNLPLPFLKRRGQGRGVRNFIVSGPLTRPAATLSPNRGEGFESASYESRSGMSPQGATP
jgi:hypothetical protein